MGVELRCGKTLCMHPHCRDCFQTVEEVQAKRKESAALVKAAIASGLTDYIPEPITPVQKILARQEERHMKLAHMDCPTGPIPDKILLQVTPTQAIPYIRDDGDKQICPVCDLPNNHATWRKIERTGEHLYVCKKCEDSIPC